MSKLADHPRTEGTERQTHPHKDFQSQEEASNHDKGECQVTDRNDLDPYWLPSVAPFAAASEPPDSPPNAPPKQPWEFPLPHQPLFPMLYPANAPLPPPRAPIFPPFATISPPIGRMPAWMDTVIPRDEGRGILGQLPRPPIGPMPVDATGSAPSMLQLPSVPPPWPMPLVPHSWGPNGPSPWSRPAAMGTEPVAPTGIDDDPFARAAQCTREAVQPPGGRQEGAAIRFMQRYIAHVAEQLLTLPQRATEAAVRFQQTGELDPGPGIETAMLTVGLPFTPKGALGSGARRPPSLPMDEASRMARADAMGFRRNVPLEYGAVPAGEKIRAAAIEANGRVFTGPTHIHALEEAERELGIPVYQMDLGHFPDGGFVTNTGRYVSRWEARDIARRASQAGRTGIWGAQLTSEDTAMSRVRPSSKVQTGATAPGLPGGEGVWGWAPLEGAPQPQLHRYRVKCRHLRRWIRRTREYRRLETGEPQSRHYGIELGVPRRSTRGAPPTTRSRLL